MTYQITYETADGSVEEFATETSKARAEKLAQNCAAGSAMNAACAVTRWFVEAEDQTVATYQVAA